MFNRKRRLQFRPTLDNAGLEERWNPSTGFMLSSATNGFSTAVQGATATTPPTLASTVASVISSALQNMNTPASVLAAPTGTTPTTTAAALLPVSSPGGNGLPVTSFNPNFDTGFFDATGVGSTAPGFSTLTTPTQNAGIAGGTFGVGTGVGTAATTAAGGLFVGPGVGMPPTTATTGGVGLPATSFNPNFDTAFFDAVGIGSTAPGFSTLTTPTQNAGIAGGSFGVGTGVGFTGSTTSTDLFVGPGSGQIPTFELGGFGAPGTTATFF